MTSRTDQFRVTIIAGFGRHFRAALSAALVLAFAQTLVETLSFAVLYEDMVVAPYAFFSLEVYDAFAKLYFLAGRFLELPPALDTFLGPGFASKLALAAPVATLNLAVGSVAVLLASVLATITGADANGPLRRRAAWFLAFFLLFECVVHLTIYASRVHLPESGGAWASFANCVRDFLSGGTAIALVLLALSAGLSWVGLRRPAVTSVVAAATLLAVGLLGPAPHAVASLPRAGSDPLQAPSSVANGYNVILVSIDSLRADHVASYGYDRATTPTIDAWARGGVRFHNTSSTTSWTLPAHMSLMAGRSLLSHGVVGDDRTLSPEVATLAEALHDGGYHTGGIVSGPYLNSRYGFARGFDEYDDKTVTYRDFNDHAEKVTSPLVQTAATEWLRRHAAGRFFLFLHYWDVHYDYNPPPPYDTQFDPGYTGSITGKNFYFNPAVNRHMAKADLDHVVALYDGEIRFVDDHLAKLKATLAEMGLAKNTLVVVTSDHGDEFFEHGNKGHHRTLYDEVVRIPLVMYVPGISPVRRVVETETSLIDIFPTILSLVGLSRPAGVEGGDLSGIAFKGDPELSRTTLSELYRSDSQNMQAALRRPDVKVIQHFKHRLLESYDTNADPKENRPLLGPADPTAGAAGELASRLGDGWQTYRARLSRGDVQTLTMDEQNKQNLRSLGYLQ